MGDVVALSSYREPEADYAPEIDWGAEHARLVQDFEESEDAGRTNTQKAERDVDYYDGKQWTENEVAKLRKRGQAALMDNHIKPKIRYLQGLEQSRRTEPNAKPRTPKHEQDANSCTDMLRFVCDDNKFDKIRSKVFKDILSAGWGGYEVVAEQRPGRSNPVIVVRRCAWDRMGADPYSAEDDYSDAGYRFLVKWMDRDEAIADYGEKAGKVFDETISFGIAGGAFDDKPKHTTWVAYNRRYRVRVVQMYFKHHGTGQICFAEFTKGGLLEYGPSPWLDEFGQPEDPYAWGSANVDRDNNRYGEIRHMIDLQDGINHRTSKFQHLINVRQTYGTEKAMGGQSILEKRKQLAKADGHVSMAPGSKWGEDFGIIPTGDMAQAQFQLLQQHEARFVVQGPNAAMQGKGAAGASGRAILANQQGGSLEANPVFDVLHTMDLQLYRKIWNRARQFCTAEQWISITDDEQNLRWVGVNVPMVDPVTGQPVIDPMTGQPVVQNKLSEIEVDIQIGDAPDVGSMQDEEFGKMVDLAKVVPALQNAPAAFWVNASNLRNKAKLTKMLEQQAQPDPMRAVAQKAEIENKNADTANKNASAEKNQAQARETLASIGMRIMEHVQSAQQPQPFQSAPASTEQFPPPGIGRQVPPTFNG